MKKKIVWLVVSCLMVAALVLASCAPAVVEEEVVEEEVEEVVEEEVAPAAEGPQYGGTVSFTIDEAATNFFDPINCSRSGRTLVMTYERLGMADWSRGPGGTGENPFLGTYCVTKFLTGGLAERWEMPDLNNCTLYLRQGVHWHNTPPVNGREFTVDDFLYTMERNRADPQSVYYSSPDVPEEEKTKYTRIDEYTVHIEIYEPDPNLVHDYLTWIPIMPHEVVELVGNLNDPDHQVGTGPFMLIDVVSGSSVTWKRNPDYWMKDPLHPENQLPYVDMARGLVIVDESTQLAALRTHKLDREFIPWDKAASLRETNPELLSRQILPMDPLGIFMRTDLEPFSDVRVRQALSLATDQPGMLRDYYLGNAFLLIWPIMPIFVDEYTPYEELPESARELLEYHPDKARELLAEAGYPDGFKTEVMVSSASPRTIDIMSLVKEQWAEVGVDLELDVTEPTTFTSILYAKTFPGMTVLGWANSGLTDCFGWAHGGWVSRPAEGEEGPVVHSIYSFSKVVDPVAEEEFNKWEATEDTAERSRILKEHGIREIELVWEVQLPTPGSHIFWTPWLKGYHGEVGMGPDPGYGNNGIYRFVWIDQDLKYEIAGIRE